MSYLVQKHWSQRNHVTFLFANTGKETQETLAFVDRCDREFGLNLVWVEAVVAPEMGIGTIGKVIDYDTAARNGEPYEAVIAKYGIPNTTRAYCTRELKQRPLEYVRKNVLGLNQIAEDRGGGINRHRYSNRRIRPNEPQGERIGVYLPIGKALACQQSRRA
jgi:hypothetical protein